MSAVAGAIVVGGVGSALIGSAAMGGASKTQAEATDRATNMQYEMFRQQQDNQRPWLEAGRAALPGLQDMVRNPATFTREDFLNNMDPAYQFNLQQGQQALERSASARGTLQSGGTLKDLTNYSQGVASNEYSNAYNRFMGNQDRQFNRLASIAGVGQTAVNGMNSAGMNAANNIGNMMTGNANAQAASGIAQGNLWGNNLSSMANGVGNNIMTNKYMDRMFPQGVGGYGGGGGGGLSLGSGSQGFQMPTFGSSLLAGR